MRNHFSLLAVLVLVGVGRSEEIDNPTYKAWAAYKPGTSLITKTTSDSAGNKSETIMTSKLVELTAEKAVVEMTIKTKVAGMEFETPANKTEHLKKVKIEGNVKKSDSKPEGLIKEGEETLKVGGKEYKCKWYETKTTIAGVGEQVSKMWICQDLPTSIVKSESSMSGPAASKTTMELVEVKAP